MSVAGKTTKAETKWWKLDWELVGRSWYADFGNLRVQIRILGSRARGDVRYLLSEVFGRFCRSDWTPDLDQAKEWAEEAVVGEVSALLGELEDRGYRVRRRRASR